MLAPWKKRYGKPRQRIKKQRHHFADKGLYGQDHTVVMCGCEKVKVKVTQLGATLCDLMDYTVHGILQARILEWVAIPYSRRSSQPRDRTQVSHIAGGFFTSSATGKPQMWELDHKEGWARKNWCFWTVVLEKTLENPLSQISQL